MGQNTVATGIEDNDVSIEALGLTVRTYNCLKRNNIFTVRQLLSMRKNELLYIRNLDSQNYTEIQERLIACLFMHSTQLIGPFVDENNDDEISH